jgi:beta-phosphoglucomutase-like phosphatase (HAD superfamily)
MPQALIFDVDGTLAETEDLHRLAFNDSFAEAGLDWSWGLPLYRELLAVTGGRERITHFAQSIGQPLEAEAVACLHADKTRSYARRIREETVPLRPGIRRLIGDARERGIALAIATTTTLANIEELLAASLGDESIRWFAAVAAGDMVRAKKPAPDIYRLALDMLGLPPASCVALEDSTNGLKAAAGAGIPTVVTISAFTQDRDFAGALSVLDHLGDPDNPCTVVDGARPAAGFVTIDDLGRWLGDSSR